ncbi:hypothetical protein [Crucian carp herpesvirus]|uniref:ORF50 n=1 Tax=Cyprinid herpesvirus 2 TaxID=317878 RepID=A0A0E3T5F8_CYHV2|nr:hypothetical protein [Cyprinid herpesvirus 2]AMB21621.1 ORF50 [Cyprinid herpesvirus 2]APB92901.1 hypothetical protein [Crucian carp herpesvirus]QAU54776.1 protein ORF50 [Cyprinid herpesvirus 2]QIM55205.1 hypothetical protein [Cyprinid herpesvirus 2]
MGLLDDLRAVLTCQYATNVQQHACGYFGRALNPENHWDDFNLNEYILACLLTVDSVSAEDLLKRGATPLQVGKVFLIKSVFPYDYFNGEKSGVDDRHANNQLLANNFREASTDDAIRLAGETLKRTVGLRLLHYKVDQSEICRLLNTELPEWDPRYIHESYPVGTFFVDRSTQTCFEHIRRQKCLLKKNLDPPRRSTATATRKRLKKEEEGEGATYPTT